MSRDASAQEIRRAFKRLARRLHPDSGNGIGVEQFHALQAAWNVLRDPEQRRAHSLALEAQDGPWPSRPGAHRPPTRPESAARPPPAEATPPRPEPQEAPAPSAPELARVSILAALARSGGRVLTRFPVRQRCLSCGDVPLGRRSCRACGGAGTLTLRVRAFVAVPPGVQDGDVHEVLVDLELLGPVVRPVRFAVMGG